MQKPPLLKISDHVTIVGAAGKVNKEAIDVAGDMIKSWGLIPAIDTHLFDDYFRFSASLTNRIAQLQDALDNPAIKAIFLARGGYGSAQLIDEINWEKYAVHPKWLIGFSDITALLMHSLSLGVMSIHGAMPVQFGNLKFSNSVISLKNCLLGEKQSISANPSSYNIQGSSSGILLGGNLSILVSLLSTSSDVSYDDKILFLEEISEPFYKIDRMLLQLARAKKLTKLKGVVVGQLTEVKDDDNNPYGKTIEEIILQYLPTDIPVAFNAPIGHEKENKPVILGDQYQMIVNESGLSLTPY